MCKINAGKKIAFLIAVLLAVAIFASLAAPVEAAGVPSKIVAFTDKKVYTSWVMNAKTTVPAYNQKATDAYRTAAGEAIIYVYAFVLDDDGNIMKGRTVQVTLNDTVFDHYDKNDWTVHNAYVSNNTYFTQTKNLNDTGTFGDELNNDGLYTTTVALPSQLKTDVQTQPRVDDQIRVKIVLKDTASGLNTTTYALVSWGKCHQTSFPDHADHVSTTASDLCTNCHGGYEHFFEEVSGTIPYEGLDAHYKVLGDSLPDSTVSVKGMNEYNWNSSQANNGTGTLSWQARSGGGAVFCRFCHQDPAGSNWFDYGTSGIRDNLADRPSCSQATSGYGGLSCHSTTEIEGMTIIPWSQGGAVSSTNATLVGINKQKAHNHTGNKANATCTLCHAVPHGLTLPNMSVDISSSGDINDQCRTCHNITGGLNITANGGTNVAHDGKTNCKNCHIDNNKLDTHLVPAGVFGGRWCLDCHNLTGKSPTNMKVDPAIVNISNQNYTHSSLNEKSNAANASRICWACHTNNSYVFNRAVNSTNLSATDHPTGYDTPKNCTACHYNTSVYNFSAPQNARHTWYATDMKTTAVTSCNDCHAQDEMVNVWTESVYPPKNNSEASSHYGKNRTTFFLGLTSGAYCAYCHQNESTVMGPFANPDNEVRSDHASQNTTPGCGNNTCHKPGRLHDDTIVVPTYNESNINTTCLSCHSNTSYNSHNNTLTCWDCHMGNVTNNNPTWIHPIQFIQYNGNFTGAKLTGATCYDCHKSTRVDNTTQYLSGKKGPKVYNQVHSNDPGNGTKWGDYWKYTPTTYQFASYQIIGGNGTINSSRPFDNIKVPSNEYMELIETRIGSGNGSTVPFNEKEQKINGPPVPNWTSSTATGGTTTGVTISATQDSAKGNPVGSLKASMKTGSGAGTYYGYIWWNYSFYYKPNSTQYAYTNASVNYNITVGSALAQTVYLNLVKPSGTVVTLNTTSSTANTGWLTLTNNSFASALNEDGSATPYKLQLYTALQGPKTSLTYTVNYDNILLNFKEKVWNRYEIVINTTGVPVNGSSKLGMSYQVHQENTSLFIYNKTSLAYELLETLDKGVFYDYVKDIKNTHHINSSDGVTGNVNVRFVDDDKSDTDSVSDKLHIRYLYIYTDRGLQYPCEQCHSPNKHYLNPSIGSPDTFKGNNKYNTTNLSTSTWCQQCHWQGASNYSGMIKEFNVTRNPSENIPPEITGNKTYGNYTQYGGKSKDGSTTYVNHTGSAYSNMNDSGCFSCHGKTGDTTSTQFMHNVQVGASGSRQCITCHNATTTQFKKIDVEAVRRGMHAGLKNASANVSNTSNPIELACWACHGDGTYNNSGQHRNANAWTCDKCHTNTTGKLSYGSATKVFEHIPPGSITPEANITANSTASWSCADCHNNSINTTALINDNEADTINARTGHYGLNRTGNKLMYSNTSSKGNSEDCVYCHNGNNANMTKWGVNTSSVKNLSNKLSPTDHRTFVNNDCAGCHNYTATSSFTFHVVEINEGAGASGPNCTNCHDIGKSATGKLVNVTAMNDTNAIHKNLNKGASTTDNGYNGSKSCWACHDEGSQPSGHNPGRYKTPYNCTDCHNASGSQSGKYPGWNVTEHVKAGTVSGTELFTPLAGNCYACHNKTEMMITAYDPDSGTGAVYGGANGGNNSTSHYGLKRNIGAGDVYCNYCHYNASSIFYLSSQNKSILEHTTNTSANISNTTSLECADCHSTGRIHNDTLAKPATEVWTSGKQDYCAPCHKAGNASATKYVYGHNSSNITAITTDCGYCHNASSQGQVSAGQLRVHTSKLTNKSTANTTCTSCHQDATYVTGQRVVYTHYPGAPGGKANTSLDSFTCEACHGNMASNKMHAPVSIPADRCNNCHNGTASGTYKATKIPYVNSTKHDNTSHNGANVNCNWCHNNTNAIQKFHFTQYPNGTLQAPGWSGWVNGTNANCTNCHDNYKDASPFYAEPIWHKGNYGATSDNCYQCHTNVSSASSGFAPIALHNVTKAIDWSYCNSCHSSGNAGAPVVDNASLASSMHYNLNGSTPSNTEPACKACHGGNSTVHKNASANSCTYCHITGSLKYTTKNVSRHIPYPYTTDVNTSRYQKVFCSDCHNNSLRAFSDPTPNSSNATTSHYGMNKTAGKLMYNTSGNTEDCIYCHRNNSNMAAWGILSTSNANLSKKGGSHATALNSDCYTCHVNSTTTPVNFHAEDISAGAGGGPDCKACHNLGGNAIGKLVNFSAMNDTNSIHKNLNKDATAVVDAENKKCWACHTTNGTAPQAGNHTFVNRYKNPYNCTDCHISKAGQNFNYTPNNTLLNVTQHKADTVNGTTIFTPLAQDCYSCHNKSEMMVQAYDPDIGTGAVYGGLHGGDDSASHYGTKRNDLGGYPQNTDGYCNYCHNNASSPFYLSDSNKSIIEHTTNTSANISNASTLRCVDCHKTGRIHNVSLNKTPQSAWTSGQQDFCAPCHKPKPTGSANKSVYQQGHDPVNSSSDRIGDCGFCHNASSQGVNGSTVRVHSPALTNTTTTATYGSCTGCHNGTAVYTGAGKQILSHMPNASQYRGNTTTSSYSCAYCHNMSGKPSMHSAGMTRSNGTCETCHFNGTSPFKSLAKNVTQLAGGMLNHSYNGSANTTCKVCHNASGLARGFHIDQYAAGIIADPERVNSVWSDKNLYGFTDTPYVDCIDCHEKFNDTVPFNAPYFEANKTGVNNQEHVGKGYMINNCIICHTYEDNVSKRVTVHNVSIEPLTGGPNCTKCHKIGATEPGKAPGNMLVNFTAFNSTNSKHRNLTNATAWGGSTVFGLIDTACWACHQSDGKQPERHPDLKDNTSLTGGSMAYRCPDCHTIGGNVSSKQPKIYQNATKIYKHYPGAVFSGGKIFTNAVNCSMCHKNSKISDINLSAYSANIDAMATNVSHYATKTDLIDTRNSTISFGCTQCHEAGDTRTKYGNATLINPNHNTMGGSSARCQKSCHNSNPNFNITLHASVMGINVGTSACYSSGCHTAPSTGGRKRR